MKITLIIGGLAFVVLGGWWLMSGGEPSYEGRSLRSWLEDFDTLRWGDTNAPVIHAVRAMGTNAIPFLVADITERDPTWRARLRRKFSSSRFAWVRESPAQRTRTRAAKALRALGPDAAPALPMLIEEIRNDGGQSVFPWIGVSAIAPSVPDTLSRMIEEFNVPAHRQQLASLAGGGTEPDVAIPFLIDCAKDTHWRTRYFALLGLARFGPEAVAAEPVVRELLNDTNHFVSSQAEAALQRITEDKESQK